MLIVLWDIVFVPLFKLLTWYRQAKAVNYQHRYTAAFTSPPNTFEGLEQTKEVEQTEEVSEISLILQKLTCVKSLYAFTNTKRKQSIAISITPIGQLYSSIIC